MKRFQDLYNPEDEFWHLYLQFEFSELAIESPPSLEKVVEWFRLYPGFWGYPGEERKQLTKLENVTLESVLELSVEHGLEFLEFTITEAVHYNGFTPLQLGQAKQVAEAFVAEFDQPKVFCNWNRSEPPYTWGGFWNVSHRQFGYTMEYFLCCIDRQRIGFVFSLNNE